MTAVLGYLVHRFTVIVRCTLPCNLVDSSWNVMAHGDAQERKWRGIWLMEWVASTLHIASEHGVSGITNADAHTSAASSRLNWRPRRFKWTRPFRRKTKYGFCVCAITFQLASTIWSKRVRSRLGLVLGFNVLKMPTAVWAGCYIVCLGMCSVHVGAVRIICRGLNSFETRQFFTHGPRSLASMSVKLICSHQT